MERNSAVNGVPDPTERPVLDLWPEAAGFLGISKDLAYKGASTGEIPTIRIGNRIKVPTAALRRLLELDPQPGVPSCPCHRVCNVSARSALTSRLTWVGRATHNR